MKIGIIGAGNIGATLAGKLVAVGHSVKLAASKGPEAIRDLAGKMGALPVSSQDAVQDVDVIVLSIPYASIPQVAGLFANVAPHVVVIDTSNYYPQFGTRIDEVENGKPETLWSSEQLGRKVVKTFNALLAKTLAEGGKPKGAAGRIAIPVAGDDPAAKAIAQQLVDAAGFDSVDAGTLADSWRQQPGTPAYCTELQLADLQAALARAVKEQAPRNRDLLMAEFAAAGSALTHETIVARNREVTGAN